MESVVETAGLVEKLGVVGIMFLIIVCLLWVLKTLHAHGKACEEARLEDAKERSEISYKLGGMEAKVDTLETLYNEHLKELTQGKTNVS